MGRLRGLRRWAGAIGHLARSWYEPLLHYALAWNEDGFRVRGDGWIAVWAGGAPVDNAWFKALVGNTFAKTQDVIRNDLAPHAALRRSVRIVVADPCLRDKTLQRLSSGSCFHAPSLAIVAAAPVDGVGTTFQGTLAHELSHAIGYQIRGERTAATWIEEGAAEFVSARVLGRFCPSLPWLYRRQPETFDLPARLESMLRVQEGPDDQSARWLLVEQAALFVDFLWEGRRANPAGWDLVCRAYAGQEPETTLPKRAVERAFDTSIQSVEQAFRRWCIMKIRKHAPPCRPGPKPSAD